MKINRIAFGVVLGGTMMFQGVSRADEEHVHDMPQMMPGMVMAPAPAPTPAPAPAAAPAGASGILWLSETAPGTKASKDHTHASAEASGQGKTGDAHEHDGHQHDHDSTEAAAADPSEVMTYHVGAKQLWLRQGADPMRAPAAPVPATDATLHLVGANGQTWDVTPQSDAGRFHAEIPLEEMGYYNAYLTQKSVSDGRLNVVVAKAELLKGTCCKKGVDPVQEKPINDAGLPIELVRDHLPDEKLYTHMVSGDKVHFTVQSYGKPLAGASVTLATQLGWRKTVVSGADGGVEFTLIRDYFPEWTKFYRLNKQTFLVSAEADVPSSGEYDGKPYKSIHYLTSLSGKYSPSPYDYRSYAFGLGISLGVVVILGAGVYAYRRRRAKPFQEVRFNEQN